MNADRHCRRCRHLRLLTELPGPDWRLPRQHTNGLYVVRAYEFLVETVGLEDDDLVAVNRRPIIGRSSNLIAVENFAGPVHEAVEFLRQPPRWTNGEQEQSTNDATQAPWPNHDDPVSPPLEGSG
jgi:hypothetical protein